MTNNTNYAALSLADAWAQRGYDVKTEFVGRTNSGDMRVKIRRGLIVIVKMSGRCAVLVVNPAFRTAPRGTQKIAVSESFHTGTMEAARAIERGLWVAKMLYPDPPKDRDLLGTL